MKKILITSLVACLGVITTSYGQYSETIRSGRPGQAIGPYTVGKNVFQVQAGIDYYDNQNDGFTDALFRYAVTDRLEFNSGVVYQYEKQRGFDLNDFNLGMRFNLSNGEQGLPPLGLQVSVSLPVVDQIDVKTKALLATSFNLTDRLGLGLNVGTIIQDEFRDAIGVYVVNFNYAISDKVSVFVESYGNYDNGEVSLSIDGGFGFLVHNDLQLDVLGGYGIEPDTSWFAGAGISWRILTGSNKVSGTKNMMQNK